LKIRILPKLSKEAPSQIKGVSGGNGVTIECFAVDDTSNQTMNAIKYNTFISEKLSANDSEVLIRRVLDASKLYLNYQ
jgi:hypothetical protein